MAAQIPVTVVFNSTGQLTLQQGSTALHTFGQQIYNLSTNAQNMGRVLRSVQADINRFGAAMRSTLGGSLNLANTMFERLYSIAGRVARYSFYTLIAQVGALGYAFTKLAKEFIAVNERFGELEIILKSVYGSVRAARQIRDEIAKITITSPLPFRDIATTVRAYAAIPALSSQVGRQIQSGTVGDQQGFFRRAIKLTEQLTTFRPDKLAEDAVFAIREAVTGELRSLVRRFEFPISLLIQASGGKDISELKRRPQAMFDAIKKAMDNIISPEAIREIAKQPKTLFQNIIEQVVQIPLLRVGRYGENAGKGFYDRFLTFFYNVLQQSGQFINQRFDPIAKRLSEGLHGLFDSLLKTYNDVSERILKILHLGTTDLPGRGQLERIFIGLTRSLEFAAGNLPKFVGAIESAVKKLIPIFEGIAHVIERLFKIVSAAFDVGPWTGAASLLALNSLPAIVRGASSGGMGRFIRGAQAARTGMLGGFIAPTTGAAAAAAAQVASRPVTVIPMPAGQLSIIGSPAQVNRWASSPGYVVPPNVAQASPGATFAFGATGVPYPPNIAPRPTFNVAMAPGPGQPGFIGPVIGPPPYSLGGAYSQIYQNARQQGFGPLGAGISSGTGAVAGRLALGLGASAGLSTGVATWAATGTAALTAVVGPMIIAAAASAAIYLLVNKVSEIVEQRRLKQGAADVIEAGLTPTLAQARQIRLQKAGTFAATYEEIYSGQKPAVQRQLEQIRLPATFPTGIRDLQSEIKSSSQTFGEAYGKILALSSNFKVVSQTQNLTVSELVSKWSDYENDLQTLTGMLDKHEFSKDPVLKTLPGVVIDSSEKAKEVTISIKQTITNFGKLFKTFGDRIEAVSGKRPQATLPLTTEQQQLLESSKSLAENLESGGGLFDEILKYEKDVNNVSVGAISRIRRSIEVFKTNSVQSISGLTSESDRVLTALQQQQNPSYEYEHVLKSEGDRLDLLNDAFEEATTSLEKLQKGQGGRVLDRMLQDTVARITKLREEAAKAGGDKTLEEMADRFEKIKDAINADIYGEAGGTLDPALRAQIAAIGGRIHQGIGSIVETVFTQLPDYFQNFAASTGRETELTIQQLRGLEVGLKREVSRVGGNAGRVGEIFGNFVATINSLRTIEDAYRPEEVEQIKAEREKGLALGVRNLQRQLFELGNEIPLIFRSDFLLPIQTASPVVKKFIDDFKKTLGEVDNQILQLRQGRQIAAFEGLVSGEIIPATGRGQNQRLQLQIQRALESAKREGLGLSPEDFEYTRYGGSYNIGENLRTQRLYEEGQVSLLAKVAAGYQEQSQRKRYAGGGEYDVLRAEQLQNEAEKILAIHDKLQADLQKRERNMLQTFGDGFFTVFDNFKERMQDLSDLGKTLGTSISEGVGGAFADAALKVKSLSQAFQDFGQNLLATATKLFINKAVENIFGLLLGGGTSNIFAQLLGYGGKSNASDYVGTAFGGAHQSGGLVPGAPSARDNRIAAVATGEYIIPASVVSRLGSSHFDVYRAGGIPTLPVKISHFSSGGAVGSPFMAASGYSMSSSAITTNVPVVVNVEINDKGQVNTKDEAAQKSNLMARGLKIAIQDEILRQHRQGGIYKKNLTSR